MASVSEQGGTRRDREVLWELARRVFQDRPVFGVGAENFGPYAAQHFRVGDTGGVYDANPATLYDRKLHSTFFQLLCEYGTVGSLIYLWMVFDFWRLNRRLRRRDFALAWKERSGGRLDLVQLSLGLEASMVGFLTSGLFYNQIFSVHWFYTIVIANTLLYYHSRPQGRDAPSVRFARARA
jgi:O-antigen ligase